MDPADKQKADVLDRWVQRQKEEAMRNLPTDLEVPTISFENKQNGGVYMECEPGEERSQISLEQKQDQRATLVRPQSWVQFGMDKYSSVFSTAESLPSFPWTIKHKESAQNPRNTASAQHFACPPSTTHLQEGTPRILLGLCGLLMKCFDPLWPDAS
ncbi:hypothetical protein AMECASPLE_031466 [Ameca splendens]|uniref:Uncharacterized protein n=1 Tax=Ameca splendens TaxID=208324 RepID=A0ABV0Z469_9TELE